MQLQLSSDSAAVTSVSTDTQTADLGDASVRGDSGAEQQGRGRVVRHRGHQADYRQRGGVVGGAILQVRVLLQYKCV